jgi:beta-galactosidase
VSAPASVPFSGILFGAAYYAEYEPTGSVEHDLDLMREAGFTVIRVGESVWSTWEPRDGEFELEWLAPVLDAAHERGIAVILGTPTYAIPPWLQAKHPELAAQPRTGEPVPWGSRQEVDYSNPLFRGYAERVIRAICGRYANHAAVIGFQVDNEPGMVLFHNEPAFEGFRAALAEKYGDVENLNREWGLTYWSHRLTSFDELWRPDGNSFPQYDLAWRRYQADVTTEFLGWQADLVREFATPDQFVTTCIAYPRPALHDGEVGERLDIAAGNPYYDMQDGLDLTTSLPTGASWTTTGVGRFFRQADRIWSTKQAPFLVTETNAAAIGGSHENLPPYPGQLAQAAFALISRGARMVEYWHWQTLRVGFETYWGGVLPHSGRPGRIYNELVGVGHALAAVGTALDDFVPDADIALLYSNASKWAFENSPALQTPARDPDRESYHRIFDAFHTGIVEADRQARILQDTQLAGLDPAAVAAEHPVLVAPGFYIAADAELDWLLRYARAGGHLVLGIRSAYADPEARPRREVQPARFAEHAGVEYAEFTSVFAPVPVTGTPEFEPGPDAAALSWIDDLSSTGASVLATYTHPSFGTIPAMTTKPLEAGRISYLGTLPNPAFATALARWLTPEPHSAGWTSNPPGRVTVQSGVTANGRVRFIFNWSGDPVETAVPVAVRDLVTGEEHSAGSVLALEPRATRVLVELDPGSLIS